MPTNSLISIANHFRGAARTHGHDVTQTVTQREDPGAQFILHNIIIPIKLPQYDSFISI